LLDWTLQFPSSYRRRIIPFSHRRVNDYGARLSSSRPAFRDASRRFFIFPYGSNLRWPAFSGRFIWDDLAYGSPPPGVAWTFCRFDVLLIIFGTSFALSSWRFPFTPKPQPLLGDFTTLGSFPTDSPTDHLQSSPLVREVFCPFVTHIWPFIDSLCFKVLARIFILLAFFRGFVCSLYRSSQIRSSRLFGSLFFFSLCDFQNSIVRV